MIFSGLLELVQNANIKIIVHTLHRVYCHDRVRIIKCSPHLNISMYVRHVQ